jgi:IMP dehydrogenase
VAAPIFNTLQQGLVPAAGPLRGVVYQIAGGLRAAMGYLGAPTLPELPGRALFVRQTGAGLRESHPHGLASMSAAPNYPGSDVP